MTSLITIKDLSAQISIPVGTLRKMVMKRQIPYIKLPNRMVRFNVNEVEKYIKERTVSAIGVGQ